MLHEHNWAVGLGGGVQQHPLCIGGSERHGHFQPGKVRHHSMQRLGVLSSRSPSATGDSSNSNGRRSPPAEHQGPLRRMVGDLVHPNQEKIIAGMNYYWTQPRQAHTDAHPGNDPFRCGNIKYPVVAELDVQVLGRAVGPGLVRYPFAKYSNPFVSSQGLSHSFSDRLLVRQRPRATIKHLRQLRRCPPIAHNSPRTLSVTETQVCWYVSTVSSESSALS